MSTVKKATLVFTTETDFRPLLAGPGPASLIADGADEFVVLGKTPDEQSDAAAKAGAAFSDLARLILAAQEAGQS